MSLVKVQKYFKKFNIDNRIILFNESSATVSLAAKALHTEEKRIAKSLSFKVNDGIILIVLAGDAKISNSKYKAFFHEKAHMLSFDEVYEKTGHEVGGVCPFALNDGVKSVKNYVSKDENKEKIKNAGKKALKVGKGIAIGYLASWIIGVIIVFIIIITALIMIIKNANSMDDDFDKIYDAAEKRINNSINENIQ